MTRDKALGILGLDTKATPIDIKSAYRRLARANHPDKMGSAELFKLVQEAYETLETTIKADAKRETESERAEVKRRENRCKADQRIIELQQKIAKASETKRRAEVEVNDALTAENWYKNKRRESPDKVLHDAVEAEIKLRVKLIHEQQIICGNKQMDVVERPDLARKVIAAEWNSMPKGMRSKFWCKYHFGNAIIAMNGRTYDDKSRYIVTSWMALMFDDEITRDLIDERIRLTDQDFRAGGFYIWGGFLAQWRYSKLAINHFSNALRIKPRLWKIYYRRGHTNIELENYVEAINDFLAGIECTSNHNSRAMRELQNGIEMAQEKANSSPRSF